MDIKEIAIHLNLLQAAGIGNHTCNALLQRFGLPSSIIAASRKELIQSGIALNKKALASILDYQELAATQEEIAFCTKHEIAMLAPYMEAYPARLKEQEHAPSLLFYKGNATLNAPKTLAVIGTRNNTEYGSMMTQEIINGLKGSGVQIISGLAAGIDGIAHKSALDNGLDTIAILGHGLATIFPAHHRALARKITQQGGLLTEYKSGTIPAKGNFPMRNRIVAGLSDFILVIETKERGGAMITAQLGFGYHKDIGAIPGNAQQVYSKGCNWLIKKDIAHLIEHTADIIDIMGWEGTTKLAPQKQALLFEAFSDEEKIIIDLLSGKRQLHFDDLLLQSKFQHAQLSRILLQLEMMNVLASLPGKQYRMSAAI